MLKLNGGLGTSMGLRHAKSLVAVKGRRTFLDVIAAQVLGLRRRHRAPELPLVLMSSFATEAESGRALDAHEGLAAEQFRQSREPKLDAETLAPVRWPAEPDLEWCPPGHGDLYAALAGSGTLARLRERGIDWLFASNADNLGAELDPRVLAWAQDAGAPFVMEVVRGTPADRKGGHIALLDGRLVLRETAQVPEGDDSFGDVERWRFYNTNNLWIDLRALEALVGEDPAGPALPLIVNHKTVDPGDDGSPAVLQLETAMGAAIGAIDGARALHVPRSRFAPVKTTDDLLVVRSGRLRARGRRPSGAGVRRRSAVRGARPGVLPAAGGLRRPLRRRAAIAAPLPQPARRRRRPLRVGREGRGRRRAHRPRDGAGPDDGRRLSPPAQVGGSLTTVTKNSSIWRTTSMKRSKSTGLVT